jgi:hypothetical protein
LLIRRLALGRIDSRQSSATLALQIEERFRQVNSAAIHAATSGAASAAAVFFRDALEPYVLLAARLARIGHATEWYWSPATAPWRPDLPTASAGRALLAGAIRTPGGLVALAVFLDELRDCGALDWLLATLRPEDGQQLWQASGWNLDLAMSSSAAEIATSVAVPALWRTTLADWVARWGRNDLRSPWLAAMAMVAVMPTRLLDPQLPYIAHNLAVSALRSANQDTNSVERNRPEIRRMIDTYLRDGEHVQMSADAIQSPIPLESHVRPTDDARSGVEQHAELAQGMLLEAQHQPMPTADAITSGRVDAPQRAGITLDFDTPWPTACGGLLFLLMPLSRLGIARRLSADPALIDAGLPIRLLRAAATRQGVANDDALLLALPPFPELECPPWLIDAWLSGLRRWCKRYTRLSMQQIICRPASVRATRTHIDIFFALATVSLDIRRAGFDIDPGWVPWLGQVVQFHYVNNADKDRQA